jgi:hypothetical protein
MLGPLRDPALLSKALTAQRLGGAESLLLSTRAGLEKDGAARPYVLVVFFACFLFFDVPVGWGSAQEIGGRFLSALPINDAHPASSCPVGFPADFALIKRLFRAAI